MPKNEVAELKKSIAKLTTRTPVSNDPRYLTQRLADLRARQEAGENIKHRSKEHAVISVSMSVDARRGLGKIEDRTKLGASEIVRRALELWAKQNGHEKEAAAFAG